MNYKDCFSVFKENEDGTCDELLVDFKEKEFEINQHVDKRSLSIGAKQRIVAHKIENNVYEALEAEITEKFDSGSVYYEERSYDAIQQERKKERIKEKRQKLISKEVIQKGLRLELDIAEMKQITNYDVSYEKDDYYDFSFIEAAVDKYANNQIDEDLFREWCWLCMRVFTRECSTSSPNLKSLYYEIGDTFDGWLFNIGRDEEGQKMCRNFWALLRYDNHQIQNAKAHSKREFSKNGIVVYTTYLTRIGQDEVHLVYITDLNSKRANFKTVYNIDYDMNIDYSFVSKTEMNDLTNRYCNDLEYDKTLTETDQLKLR